MASSAAGTVPEYYRSRSGRVYRVQRARVDTPPDRARYLLRAVPVQGGADGEPPVEALQEVDLERLRDRIRLGHHIATPEQAFTALWQQLRMQLDAT